MAKFKFKENKRNIPVCDREGIDFPAIINTAKKDWRAER